MIYFEQTICMNPRVYGVGYGCKVYCYLVLLGLSVQLLTLAYDLEESQSVGGSLSAPA